MRVIHNIMYVISMSVGTLCTGLSARIKRHLHKLPDESIFYEARCKMEIKCTTACMKYTNIPMYTDKSKQIIKMRFSLRNVQIHDSTLMKGLTTRIKHYKFCLCTWFFY